MRVLGFFAFSPSRLLSTEAHRSARTHTPDTPGPVREAPRSRPPTCGAISLPPAFSPSARPVLPQPQRASPGSFFPIPGPVRSPEAIMVPSARRAVEESVAAFAPASGRTGRCVPHFLCSGLPGSSDFLLKRVIIVNCTRKEQQFIVPDSPSTRPPSQHSPAAGISRTIPSSSSLSSEGSHPTRAASHSPAVSTPDRQCIYLLKLL